MSQTRVDRESMLNYREMRLRNIGAGVHSPERAVYYVTFQQSNGVSNGKYLCALHQQYTQYNCQRSTRFVWFRPKIVTKITADRFGEVHFVQLQCHLCCCNKIFTLPGLCCNVFFFIHDLVVRRLTRPWDPSFTYYYDCSLISTLIFALSLLHSIFPPRLKGWRRSSNRSLRKL